MTTETNIVLYGHDSSEGIVAVDVWGSTVTEFIQQLDGNVVSNEIYNYCPWYLKHTDRPNLDGANHFNTLFRATAKEFKGLYDQREHLEDLLLIGNKSDNYLIESGKTLFKGMAFDEVHTVGFDIETTGLDPETSEVRMVSVVDNRGFKRVIYSPNECEVITQFVILINELNPSILLSYNGFSFDIPFMAKRAEVRGLDFGIGRNGSVPIQTKIMVRTGVGQQDHQLAWRVWGRQCIDLYHCVVHFDFTDRKLRNYKLKNVIAQYGLEKENRVHLSYLEIFAGMESGDPREVARVTEYCLADSEDLLTLHRHICQAEFYLTQLIPMNYQRVVYAGSVGRLNVLMIRDYIYNETSIPVWNLDRLEIEGASVEANEAGIFRYVGDSDVASMYPNLMIQNNIFPVTDTLRTMHNTLVDLTKIRIELKHQLKLVDDPVLRSQLDGQQKAVKIFLNSYFGALSSPGFYWRDNEKCASVTRHGRALILKIKEYIESQGFKIIALDTDGISYTNGQPFDINDMNAKIQSILPPGIDIESKSYPGLIVFKKKTYAILNDDGSILPKGAAITSTATAPLIRHFINTAIGILFNIVLGTDTYDSLRAYYDTLIHDIETGQLPIDEFTMIQKVVKNTRDYAEARGTPTEAGRTRSKLPLYELMLDGKLNLAVGDKTETYWASKLVPKPLTATQTRKRETLGMTGTLFEVAESPKLVTIKTLKWSAQYDPTNPDVYVEYYVEHLNNRIYELLGLVIPKDVFNLVFSKMNPTKREVHTSRFIYRDYYGKYDTIWKRITVDTELDLIKQSGEDIYVTIQKFANVDPVEGELVYHPFYFDLDSAFVEDSLHDAQGIVNYFTNVLQVKPEYITVWFSGAKGFHIEVAPEVFDIAPMVGLTIINKEIAKWLIEEYQFTTIDTASIYSSRRMWRVPFSINSKTGLRKTWIPDLRGFTNLDELMTYVNLHQDLITEYTEYFRWTDAIKPVVNRHIIPWFKSFVDRYNHDLAKVVIRKPIWKYTKLKGKFPNCIEYLRQHSIINAGDRNPATMTLLSFFSEFGYPIEQAVEAVVNWTLRIPPGLTSTTNYNEIKKNVSSIAKTIYRNSDLGKHYVFECGYIKALLKGRFECPSRCPLTD